MFVLMKRLFSSLWPAAAPEDDAQPIQMPETEAMVPPGFRVYAVGDIHGRLDLLEKIHAAIQQDGQNAPPSMRKLIVYLGDYIDRGDQSQQVVETLVHHPLPGFDAIFLKGNHEDAMMNFLARPDPAHDWLRYGGMATVLSYRVRVANRISAQEKTMEMRDKLVEALPQEHYRFLSGLHLRFELGDYLFVHAGVRPGMVLEQQRPHDLLWIRDPFLSSPSYHGKVVVHGHTVTPKAIFLPNRIGIDTGAYHSGNLTCLVLEGTQRRTLSTG